MLCLTLTGRSMEENSEILSRNRSYVSMAELRLDCLESGNMDFSKILSFEMENGLPVILTCRKKSDGGLFRGTEELRISLLSEALKGNFSYVDLELDLRGTGLEETARSHNTRIIRSFHDFNGVPSGLAGTIMKIQDNGEIPKAAVMINGIEDLISLFEIKDEVSGGEMILVGMGLYGVPSRILYGKTGSMLMFCSEKDTGNTGILSPEIMKTLYHADSVTAKTRVFGIAGNPVAHSRSPLLHNRGFEKLEYDGVYVPFAADDISAFFRFAQQLPLSGFSVTMPYKTAVLPYLSETGPEVTETGACNTVIRTGSGWKGMNTDYYGFISLVKNDIESGKIRTALVIGAGGAAGAVASALRHMDVDVTILNRTESRGKELAERLSCSYDRLCNAVTYCGKADLVVQTTSVGMGDGDADPVPDYVFSGRETVCDIVYSPPETSVLRRAGAAGCNLIHGIELLQAQGLIQFESFTGFRYP